MTDLDDIERKAALRRLEAYVAQQEARQQQAERRYLRLLSSAHTLAEALDTPGLSDEENADLSAAAKVVLELTPLLVSGSAPPDQAPPVEQLTEAEEVAQVKGELPVLVDEYLRTQLVMCEAVPDEHPMKTQLKAGHALASQMLNGIVSRLETQLTRADVLAIIAEVAERANGRDSLDEPALLKLAEAAKDVT